jgi:hypothetical protein
LGGGAFGNDDDWIDGAIKRALAVVEYAGLDIRIFGYGHVSPEIQSIADDWAQRP